MAKNLPARPNLDHLRRQAKALLAALEARDPNAIATIQKHLPAAQELTAAEVAAKKLRLADAQSAIARQSGFASWPHLARHVELLRALEGRWEFARLEVDGHTMPGVALQASRILIDGDRFRTESPEANYEGVFNIDVEAEPHAIDIEFVAGPEAGNWNYGIFRLEGDQLELCLDLNGKPRPKKFAAPAGSGHACELLRRASAARPENVTGGVVPAAKPTTPATTTSATENRDAFAYVASPTLTKLEGPWSAVKIVRDGQSLPGLMLKLGKRTATKNEVKITFAGQTMIHALVRLDETKTPVHVDYFNLGGECKDQIQHGIMQWSGNEACFCMAAPGQPRPEDFNAPSGSLRTFSQWRKK